MPKFTRIFSVHLWKWFANWYSDGQYLCWYVTSYSSFLLFKHVFLLFYHPFSLSTFHRQLHCRFNVAIIVTSWIVINFVHLDINECLLRNGHGPCQDTCHNSWSGYSCSCVNLPGTQLAADNHSCIDSGECFNNNGGCSHTCLSSIGRIFCSCPSGYHILEDGKSCEGL